MLNFQVFLQKGKYWATLKDLENQRQEIFVG